MTIAFLVTGDEIVHGDTLDTNSHKLAKTLSSEGLSLGQHLTCSDKEDELLECMDYLAQSHDILIIIGGLGPTSDDRTRFALAQHLKTDLTEFKEASKHIRQLLDRANVKYTENNAQQALFPKGTELLPNPNGTAVGGIFRSKTHTYILLPGPPRECLPMFSEHVLPSLIKGKRSNKDILRWRLFGVAEAEMADLFEKALDDTSYKTGYRLESPYLEVKVCFPKGEKDKVRAKLDPILKPYIISPADQNASTRLREMLENWTTPFSVHDAVSGGILQSLIQTPKTRNIVQFSTSPAHNVHFIIRGFAHYWAGEGAPEGKDKIIIEYQNSNLLGSEEHYVPCRGKIVRYFAAEWLCYRIFHLLNQLH